MNLPGLTIFRTLKPTEMVSVLARLCFDQPDEVAHLDKALENAWQVNWLNVVVEVELELPVVWSKPQ